jgi:acyl carrier protein
MFSSISSVWGSQGLSHYAAANQFMDSLAHYRRALGLPATSINWGPWDGGGMTSADIATGLRSVGVGTLGTEEAFAELGRLLAAKTTQAAVARVDWSTLRPVFEARRRRPLLDDVAPTAAPALNPPLRADGPRFSRVLREAAPPDRTRLLAQYVREQVAAVLGLKVAVVGIDRGFFDMGMDSLMSATLKKRLEAELEIPLSATLTFNYPSVGALADHLGQLLALESVVPVTLANVAEVRVTEPAAGREDLSEEELAEMLAVRLENLR